MRRIFPSILSFIISGLVYMLCYQPQSQQDKTIIYLFCAIILFFLLNTLFLGILKNATATMSIGYIMGLSGISMFTFLGLILAYPYITSLELTIPTALFLFIGYILMKIGLLYPLLKK